ncbi:MAG: type II and III secretion system protein [Candidatus Cloacimonetes bacterium]|nr:type II and III secretion system protein [Candidatus Cloacimonadota bacterium]
MKKTLIFFILIFLSVILLSQSKYKKEELITITRDISIPEAIKTLEIMSQQFEGKKIINMSVVTTPIGIPIKQLYWRVALDLIVSYNNLVLEELPGAYVINDFILEEEIIPEEIEIITPDTKQIRISAIFFKADKTLLNSIGIDWSTLFHGEVMASMNFKGASRVSDDIFEVTGATSFESGTLTIDINTLLRIIEANRKGTIIARPNIVVISGKKGFIQVGEDFSIKTLDEAGNITEKFFEVGIILEVTPTIITNEDKEAIHLVAKVEKSAASPGEITTIIHKSTSNTEVILFDGEETVIGGLYDTEVTQERSGIPILKDLPWWVLGIRYLTGYNKYEKIEREMIVIIKAEIIESFEKRIEKLTSIREKIKKMRESTTHIDTLFNAKNKERDDLNEKENE